MRKLPIVALVSVLLLGACGGADDPATPPLAESSDAPPVQHTAGITPLPRSTATALAQRLVAAKDLETAASITREVLARGGVATLDGDRILVEAIGPASAFRATPLETLHMAMEARQRPHAGQLTAAEFAQMLEGFGWPFRNAQPDRAADHPYQAALPEALEQIAQQERAAQEDEEFGAQDAQEAAVEAGRETANQREETLIRQLQEATLVWQKARQAVAKAPVADKPAAQARVKEAWDARNALIEQRRVAQQDAGSALREMREHARNEDEDARRQQQIAARIGPDYAAGEQLMEMLAVWVREAAKDPDDPRNFTPLFLAEMARLQNPPVDLTGSRFSRPGRGPGLPVDLRGPPRSAQLRLTLLELQLFAAAFHRRPHAGATAANDNAAWSRTASSFADLLLPSAMASSTPCSDFRKELRKDVGDAAGEATVIIASEALGDALGAAVNVGPDGAANSAALGKMMGSLGIAAKIFKLVAFYADTQVSVHAKPDPTHKPPAGNFGIAYTATAGVGEDELKEYERLNADKATQVQRDCYSTLGLPTMANIAELASEAENWVVEWRLVEGAPEHARIADLRFNKFKKGQIGVLGMQLKRTSPHAASARLVVELFPESTHSGTQVRTYVTTKASVNAAGTPSLGTWVNALKGGLGLADALVELAAGWTQSMIKPKAYASAEVQYHCPKPVTLHNVAKAVADGAIDDGPDSCLLEAAKKR